jgi:hypothetical protein
VIRQAVVLVAVLVLTAAVGYSVPVLALVALILGVGLVYIWRYRAFRVLPVPDHRRERDRLVACLLAVAAGVPGGVATTMHFVGSPFTVDLPGGSWFVTAAVVAAVIFASSLVDWYWILPRLSGLGAWPRPCEIEVPRDNRPWRFVTQHWYGHRLLAEFVGVAAFPATAGYVASTDDSHRTLWGVIAAACTIGLGIGFARWWWTAWGNVHNPDVTVGSLIRAQRLSWGRPHQRVLYVVDVDIRKSQCMFVDERRRSLNGERDPANAFATKRDTQIKPDEDVGPLPTYRPPCADRCTGINWYCRNNPRAYDPN